MGWLHEHDDTPEEIFKCVYGYQSGINDYVEVTLKEVAEAIRQNGLPKVQREFFDRDIGNKIVGACAVGQAGINLSVYPSKLFDVLGHVHPNEGAGAVFDGLIWPLNTLNLADAIATINDETEATFEEIADFIEEFYPLDTVLYLRKTHEFDLAV